jgi:hypothetical protein
MQGLLAAYTPDHGDQSTSKNVLSTYFDLQGKAGKGSLTSTLEAYIELGWKWTDHPAEGRAATAA